MEPPASRNLPKWGYELSYSKGNPWPDAPMPPTEAARLERIKTLNLSQHFTNTELRELLQFACSTIQCSVGAISVVAVSTSLLVTTIGLRGDQLPRDLAPDAHVLMSREPTVVLDTQLDPRFAKNPLAASTNMRFFIGVPLIVKDSGVIVGALNLIDTAPRERVKPADLKALEVVASRIINKMDSRVSDGAADEQSTAPRTGVLLF
jgi:GAF domain-containing protein